jgi:hypothetical protein
VTRKHAEKKKKNFIKAAGNKKEREFTVQLKRWATGEKLREAWFLCADKCFAGGVAHAGERATVSANARRLLSRFTRVKVKSEKKAIKWVVNSWDYVGDSKKAPAAKTAKKPAAEKKKPAADKKKPAAAGAAGAKKPAAEKKTEKKVEKK